MGKVIRIIGRLVLLISACICLCITGYNYIDMPINTSGSVYLVNEYADTYYEMLSDNVGITTINGISNVYVNMLNDGYSVYDEDVQQSYIDVSFVKDNYPSYRYYFTYPECRITFFCDEYENSYTGISYIIERK